MRRVTANWPPFLSESGEARSLFLVARLSCQFCSFCRAVCIERAEWGSQYHRPKNHGALFARFETRTFPLIPAWLSRPFFASFVFHDFLRNPSRCVLVCVKIQRSYKFVNHKESTLFWLLSLRKDRCFCFVGRVQDAWSLRWVYVLFLFKLGLHEGSRLDEGDTIGMLVLEGRVLEVLLRFDDLNWEVNRK